MKVLRQDARYGLRALVKSPGFTIVAILTLGVGIGANVAMFGVTHAALVRALPFSEPERLVLGRTTYNGNVNPWISAPDYFDYRDQTTALASFAAFTIFPMGVTITGGEEPERATTAFASFELSSTLGIAPQLGRSFTAGEGELAAPEVTVLSHRFWMRRFGGSPDAVGEVLIVDGRPFTVVGVMPAGFHFMVAVDFWVPMRDGGPMTGARQFHNWLTAGRLAPGVTLEQARTEFDVISAQLAAAYPESNHNKALLLTNLQDALVEDYRPSLLLLMGAIGLVLLIACGNLASLLLARGSARSTEISVRAALGASRLRLVAQLLTESGMIAIAGGVLGLLVAVWLQRLFAALVSLQNLGIRDLGLSAPMLAFTLFLALATTLLFGVIPALTASRADPTEGLKSGVRTSVGRGGTRVQSGLVVAQVALSVMLLIGSGLLIRSFARLRGVDPGFDPTSVLTAEIRFSFAEYPDGESRAQFLTGLLDDVRAIPGVRSAAAISRIPIRQSGGNYEAWALGNRPADPGDVPSAYRRSASPGYFQAMGITLLRGRDFRVADAADAPQVGIINDAMAAGLFPDVNPIGRMVAVDNGGDERRVFEVVGVVATVQMNSLTEATQYQLYHPYPQRISSTMRLAIRTHGLRPNW